MDLRIDDVISTDLVILDLDATERDDAIDQMARRLEDDGRVSDRATYVQAVQEREKEGGGTGMEMGVAIPHAKSPAVRRASVVFARSTNGVDFGGDSEQPSTLLFLIAAPAGSEDVHVTLLAKLARRLIHDSFRQRLYGADSPEAVMQILREEVKL
jgi:fructose-specific phosphotransferase system IIA component